MGRSRSGWSFAARAPGRQKQLEREPRIAAEYLQHRAFLPRPLERGGDFGIGPVAEEIAEENVLEHLDFRGAAFQLGQLDVLRRECRERTVQRPRNVRLQEKGDGRL